MLGAGRRARRILSATVLTGVLGAALIGVLLFAQWHRRQALRGDVAATLEQSAKELIRSLNSRRGTLTLLRDAFARSPDLGVEHRRALGGSAVAHTRHLLGIGLLERGSPVVWWHTPQTLSPSTLRTLNAFIQQRSRLRGAWRVPATFMAPDPNRPLLVMGEPLKGKPAAPQVLLGVFDARPLAEDFVASAVGLLHPVQLLEDTTSLFRGAGWRSALEDAETITVGRTVSLDATRWTLQMQPGSTGMARALSWFHLLLVALSAAAGVGLLLAIWLLAARAWLLQRAVTRRTSALRRTLKRVRQLAVTDELTGLYNRRFFLDRWGWECDRAQRYGRPLACLMIDVNGFKQVNDALGHQAGDLVLKDVARELRTLLRQSDILARFGGDEFIIGLPETSPSQAQLVADKLRSLRLPIASDPDRPLTVSLSVGISRAERVDQTPQDIIKAADASLYASKARRPSRLAAARS